MPRRPSRAVAYLFGLLAAAISAAICGCTPAISTTTFTPTQRTQHYERQGIELDAEPVTDKGQLKSLFGVESLGRSTIAVYIKVLNLKEGAMILVQPENFRLGSGEVSDTQVGSDRGQKEALVGSIVAAGGLTVAPFALAPLAMPVILAGVSSQAQQSVVRNNVTRRELKSATLDKGESVSGFLFFQLPEGQEPSAVKLEVTIHEAGTKRAEEHELTLKVD